MVVKVGDVLHLIDSPTGSLIENKDYVVHHVEKLGSTYYVRVGEYRGILAYTRFLEGIVELSCEYFGSLSKSDFIKLIIVRNGRINK